MSDLTKTKYADARATAAYFGLHPRTVLRLARRGEIPVLRVGRYVRFDVQAVEAALQNSKAVTTTGTFGSA